MNKLQNRPVFSRNGSDTSTADALTKPTQREIDDWRGKEHFTREMYHPSFSQKGERMGFDMEKPVLDGSSVPKDVKAEFRCRICKRVFTEDPIFRQHQILRNGKRQCPQQTEADDYEYR